MTTEYTVTDRRNCVVLYCGDARSESDAIRKSGIDDQRMAEVEQRDSSHDRPLVDR